MYQANFAGARRPPGKLREAALPPDGHVGEILHGRPLPGLGRQAGGVYTTPANLPGYPCVGAY